MIPKSYFDVQLFRDFGDESQTPPFGLSHNLFEKYANTLRDKGYQIDVVSDDTNFPITKQIYVQREAGEEDITLENIKKKDATDIKLKMDYAKAILMQRIKYCLAAKSVLHIIINSILIYSLQYVMRQAQALNNPIIGIDLQGGAGDGDPGWLEKTKDVIRKGVVGTALGATAGGAVGFGATVGGAMGASVPNFLMIAGAFALIGAAFGGVQGWNKWKYDPVESNPLTTEPSFQIENIISTSFAYDNYLLQKVHTRPQFKEFIESSSSSSSLSVPTLYNNYQRISSPSKKHAYATWIMRQTNDAYASFQSVWRIPQRLEARSVEEDRSGAMMYGIFMDPHSGLFRLLSGDDQTRFTHFNM